MTPLELLSPAKDIATGKAAIDCGADAVYIGAEHHGARAGAANSIGDIAQLCNYARQFEAKVYVTLNTLIYDAEVGQVRDLICRLYDARVDALIVQDMAVLELDIPPIELHASTQCDIRTPAKARFLENVGFSQLVLPREFTLEQIREVRQATSVPLEAFVHGALCVSYSGACRAGFLNGGRSGNRGECPQICRLPYDLIDGKGETISSDRHLLSLKDMNRIAYLRQMADAGISSFKIEGRLKSIEYVRNVTAAYSEALNNVIESSDGLYCRSSVGISRHSFIPDINRSFNRGFTSYFLMEPQPGKKSLGSHLYPGHVGMPLAKVTDVNQLKVTVDNAATCKAGDGVGFFDNRNSYVGFRINKVEGNTLLLARKPDKMPAIGTLLYRNFDKEFNDALTRKPTSRVVPVEAHLTSVDNELSLTLNDLNGTIFTGSIKFDIQIARTPQKTNRKNILGKTGDTIYRVVKVVDEVGDNVFIPASVLTEFRRDTVARFHEQRMLAVENRKKQKSFDKVKVNDEPAQLKINGLLAENISNELSRKFYLKHGVTDIENAVEILPPSQINLEKTPLMTTRYCLRRELGACLRTPDGKRFTEPLTLIPKHSGIKSMSIDFDCAKCEMHLFTAPEKFVKNTSKRQNL